MTVLPLLAVGLIMKFMAILFVLASVILILVILIQKGRGGGLSGAFGGGMASGLLGSKTGDFLTWVTIVLVAVFLVLGVLLARFYRPKLEYGAESPVPTEQTAPQETPPVSETPPVPETSPVPETPSDTTGTDVNVGPGGATGG